MDAETRAAAIALLSLRQPRQPRIQFNRTTRDLRISRTVYTEELPSWTEFVDGLIQSKYGRLGEICLSVSVRTLPRGYVRQHRYLCGPLKEFDYHELRKIGEAFKCIREMVEFSYTIRIAHVEDERVVLSWALRRSCNALQNQFLQNQIQHVTRRIHFFFRLLGVVCPNLDQMDHLGSAQRYEDAVRLLHWLGCNYLDQTTILSPIGVNVLTRLVESVACDPSAAFYGRPGHRWGGFSASSTEDDTTRAQENADMDLDTSSTEQ